MISLEQVRDAAARLSGILRTTPITERESLSALVGRPLLLKEEFRQRTGSYKFRGAYNTISRLPEGAEVVAASAGNHAQGVALAAALTGRKATIFMPVSAAWPKVEATKNYGAEIRMEGTVVDDSLVLAKAYSEQCGATFVPPFDHPLIIAGQGTVGIEILDERPDTATVIVPIGGGGLISGVSTAVKAMKPTARVIGVEAAGAASMTAALMAGELVQLEHMHTMADGIATKSVSELTLQHVQAHVDDVVTVTEEEIGRAVVLLLERAKSVVEPAGAVGLAAILAGKIPGTGPAAVILSGGNIDPLLMMRLIDFGLSSAGRYLVMRILLDDRPGQLAALSTVLGDLRLNIIEVEHHRSGLNIGVDEVDITVTVETRGPEHADSVMAGLRRAGYTVEPVR